MIASGPRSAATAGARGRRAAGRRLANQTRAAMSGSGPSTTRGGRHRRQDARQAFACLEHWSGGCRLARPGDRHYPPRCLRECRHAGVAWPAPSVCRAQPARRSNRARGHGRRGPSMDNGARSRRGWLATARGHGERILKPTPPGRRANGSRADVQPAGRPASRRRSLNRPYADWDWLSARGKRRRPQLLPCCSSPNRLCVNRTNVMVGFAPHDCRRRDLQVPR